MPFTENTDLFIDAANGFAQTATVDGVPVDGIYNSGFQSAINVETDSPSLTCKTGDLPESIAEDSIVIVEEGTFKVTEIHNDAGISTLMLYQD